MLRWDEAALVRELGHLGTISRVAFAASCAERLFPAYADYCRRGRRGDPDMLAEALDRVWQHLLGDLMRRDLIRAELGVCMALIPTEEDEPWIEEQAYAEDAASAVAYALRALETDEAQEAAWAARRAYEAADHYVIHRLGAHEGRGVSQVLAHPIVQAELSRQRRDLDELASARQGSAELVTRLRDRSKADAPTFFASP